MVLSNMCDGKQGQDQNQLYDIPGELQDQLHEGLPWKSLNELVRRDAVREGDGSAIITHYCLDLPEFFAMNFIKLQIFMIE